MRQALARAIAGQTGSQAVSNAATVADSAADVNSRCSTMGTRGGIISVFTLPQPSVPAGLRLRTAVMLACMQPVYLLHFALTVGLTVLYLEE